MTIRYLRGNVVALKAASLICKDWTKAARRHLFHTVHRLRFAVDVPRMPDIRDSVQVFIRPASADLCDLCRRDCHLDAQAVRPTLRRYPDEVQAARDQPFPSLLTALSGVQAQELLPGGLPMHVQHCWHLFEHHYSRIFDLRRDEY